MGTLILTEPMEGHKKQLIPLLLLSLGRTAVQAQNCWQCLGTGSDINACAVPGNGTMQVPIPEQAYLTSDLANICMTRVVFDISACPKEGNCQNTAVLEQVSRGLPQLELEYQMFKSNEQATNATGTVCTSNGALMTCTTLCEGDLCNSNTVSASLAAYTETVTTKCILCQQIAGSDNFNDCLMGSNTNYTQICAGSDEGVGNNLLAGMCVTIVNYDNSTLAPASVYRGCGIPPQSVIYPTGEVEYSTLGQCSETEISYNGNVVPTWSCVKGYVQDIQTSEGSYIANYNRAAPGPMNATCLQCNAVMGDMQFDACMNPNATASSADLAGMGVGMSVCELGISECSTVFLYSSTAPGSTPVMVQRSCGNVNSTTESMATDPMVSTESMDSVTEMMLSATEMTNTTVIMNSTMMMHITEMANSTGIYTTGMAHSTGITTEIPSVTMVPYMTEASNNTDCNTDGYSFQTETCDAGTMAMNSSLPCNSLAPEPIPAGNSCYVCKESNTSADFDSCMSPNGTSSMVEECGCGANACMSATMYNANATVIGVQRGCGNAPGTASQDVCNFSDPTDLDTSDVICTSQCTASAMPCNDYNNAYTPGATLVNASVFVSLSAVLLMISMML